MTVGSLKRLLKNEPESSQVLLFSNGYKRLVDVKLDYDIPHGDFVIIYASDKYPYPSAHEALEK